MSGISAGSPLLWHARVRSDRNPGQNSNFASWIQQVTSVPLPLLGRWSG